MTETIAAPSAPSPQAITAWKGKADKIVALSAELAAAEAKLEKKLKLIREAHEPEIEALKREAKRLGDEFAAFGREHREVLFAEGSELRTKVAVITGRANPPSVALEDGFEEREVVEALEADKETRGFVAIKKSLDRAALKRALASGAAALAEKLGLAGVVLASGFSVSVRGKGD